MIFLRALRGGIRGAPTLRPYHIMAMVNAEPFYLACFLRFTDAESVRPIPPRRFGVGCWKTIKHGKLVTLISVFSFG